MKKLAMVAAAMCTAMAAPAWAAPADEKDFAINATVAQECSATDPADVNFNTVPIVEAAGPNALRMTADVNVPNQSNIWLSCNYATSIRLESQNQGLVNPAGLNGADSAEFTALIHYRMSLLAPDSSFSTLMVNTITSSEDDALATSAFHSPAILSLKIELDDNNTRRPVAGTYTDTATIELGPI